MVNAPRKSEFFVNLLRREWILFFTALMFFTRLPVPKNLPFSKDYLNRSARYFTLVGVIVGGIGAVVIWLTDLVFPPSIVILLSMAATILATGAFHEDGFADVCDGFGGGYDKARVLEIMKDSRLGTFGTVGLGLLLSLKFFALQSIPATSLGILLIAGHSLSRLASVSLISVLDYVRDDLTSKAKPLSTKLSAQSLLFAAIFGIAPLFFLGLGFAALWILLPVAVVTILSARYFVYRIGGYTGDCLGAVQQISELTVYLSVIFILWIGYN